MTAEVAQRTPPDAGERPSRIARLRVWLAADPGRKVALAATLLVAGQVVLRGWVANSGYFALDDFTFIGRAARFSPADLHGFLLQPYNSHLMPGAFVEVWVLTKLWPLNWGAVVLVDLVLQVLVDLVFYRLLRELFGARPAILVPFAIFVYTPISLSAFVWWAAALNQLPQQLAMLTALWCQTRYLRTGRVRVGVCGAVVLVGGLLFSEKTLLTVPLVFAYTGLIFATGNVARRIVTATRAHWRVWLAYLAVAVPYTAYYVLEVPSPGHSLDGGDVVQMFGSAFAHAIGPGLVGGPWSWHPVGTVGALADPGRPITYLAGVGVLAFVVWTIAWRRRAILGWLLALGYALAALALLAFSRAVLVGPIIGDELRYVTDVGAVAVLGGALAVLRPAGTWRTTPEPVERRAWTQRPGVRRGLADLRAAMPRVGVGPGVAALVTLVIASSATSTVRFAHYWSRNPARAYVSTLRTELSLAPARLVIYDQEVPERVAWALSYPYNRLSYLLRALPYHPRYLQPGRSASSLVMPDNRGRLDRVAVLGPHAVAGPLQNGCGWLLGVIPVRVKLDGTTVNWSWVLRMGYLASADTAGTLRAGRTVARVEFQRGLHELYVEVTGAMSTVTFSGFTHNATVCTSDLEVGKPVPLEGPIP